MAKRQVQQQQVAAAVASTMETVDTRPSTATVISVKAAGGLPMAFTAHNIIGWFSEEAERRATALAAPDETRRIVRLMDMCKGVSIDEAKKVMADLTDGTAKGSQERKNRMSIRSDLKAIFGALRWVPDAVPMDRGYGFTVTACRSALEEAGKTWTGEPLKDSHRRKAEKAAQAEVAAERAARIAYHDTLNRTGDQDAAQAAEDKARFLAEEEARTSDINKLAAGLVKKYGARDGGDWLMRVCERIDALLTAPAHLAKTDA